MSAKRTTMNTTWESVKVVTKELLREPVKEAVREALREEAVSVETGDGEAVKSERRPEPSRQSDQGGRSWLTWIGAMVALGSVVYLARRRMRSSSGTAWSEPSAGDIATDDTEGGYVSEGEMQTAETAGSEREETGSSVSSSDQ